LITFRIVRKCKTILITNLCLAHQGYQLGSTDGHPHNIAVPWMLTSMGKHLFLSGFITAMLLDWVSGCLYLFQMCPKHGTDFLEYKCRYCCSVAVFFCFGTTHFCNACHDDFQRVTSIPKNELPHCPAGMLLSHIEADWLIDWLIDIINRPVI